MDNVQASTHVHCRYCDTYVLGTGYTKHRKTYKCRVAEIERKYNDFCTPNVAEAPYEPWAHAFISVMQPTGMCATYQANVIAFMRQHEITEHFLPRPSEKALRTLIKNGGAPL